MSKKKKKNEDVINHPNHYTKGIETIDYIRSWKMDYVCGLLGSFGKGVS